MEIKSSNRTTTTLNTLKHRIHKNFSTAASTYTGEAWIQQKSAIQLADSLRPWKGIIPAGPVWEAGCGTGFLSRELAAIFPDRSLEITDLSDEMVAQCRYSMEHPNVKFYQKDAEEPLPKETYALICHNFVAQWFKDPAYTLNRFMEAVVPGGLMVAAFPGKQSFPEWKAMCKQAKVPFTGNKMPDTEELGVKLSLGPHQIDFHETAVKQHLKSAGQFFHMLKRIGAATQLNEKSLTISDLKTLIQSWNRACPNGITCSWHVVYLAVKKD